MKIINREMGGGKSRALVELMLEPGNEDVVYVAPTVAQAQRIGYEYARQLDPGVDRKRFIAASALGSLKGRNVRVVIDEVGGVLSGLVGASVLAIAGTDEDLQAGQRQRIRGER